MKVDVVLREGGKADLVEVGTGTVIVSGTRDEILSRADRVDEIHYRHHPEELANLMCQDRKAIAGNGWAF